MRHAILGTTLFFGLIGSAAAAVNCASLPNNTVNNFVNDDVVAIGITCTIGPSGSVNGSVTQTGDGGLAIRALLEKSPDAGRLVAVHAQAAGNLIRTRQDVLALEQQEARLLTAEWVKETIAAHDGAIVTLVKAMPRMMAGRIAPHDSEHAEAELTRWVEEEFLRTLYRSNPWNTPKT